MGVLIQMTRPSTPVAVRAQIAGDAEILFFTGVRYYRVTDDDEIDALTSGHRIERAQDEHDARHSDHHA